MTFIRYIATQLAAYGIDMGLFLALVYVGSLGPIIANVFAKIAAGIFTFFVHRSFTFRLEKRKHNRKQMYRYFMLLGLNVPLSAGVLGLLLLVIDPQCGRWRARPTGNASGRGRRLRRRPGGCRGRQGGG